MMIMGPVYDNGTSLVVAAVVVVFVDSCVQTWSATVSSPLIDRRMSVIQLSLEIPIQTK